MGLAASRQEAFWEACGFGHVHRARKFLEEGEIDVNWVSYVVCFFTIDKGLMMKKQKLFVGGGGRGGL